MTSPESDFRDRLLNAEPLDSQRQHQFEQQVRDLVDPRIRGRAWLYWILLLIGTGFSTLFWGRQAAMYMMGQLGQWPLFMKLGTFTCFVLSLLAMMLILYFMIRRRANFRIQLLCSKVMPAGAFLLVVVTFLWSCDDPSKPGATWFGIYTLAAFVFASSITLWNRIVATDRHTQERLLRIEYLLAGFAERLPSSADKPESES